MYFNSFPILVWFWYLVLDFKKNISYSLTEYLIPSLGYIHRPAALTSAIFIFIWIVDNDISGIKMLYFISIHFIFTNLLLFLPNLT